MGFVAISNPDEPVAAKRKSRFIGELEIKDWYGRKKAQKAQKQNFRACNFNVLQWTKIEILTFYESIKIANWIFDVHEKIDNNNCARRDIPPSTFRPGDYQASG